MIGGYTMTLDDILFCLTDIAENHDRFLDSRLASPYLSNCMNKQTAAIKEVVSLLLLIRDSEGVELTADPDGVYYEAAGRFGVRLGTIMKEDKHNGITESN